jgi:hypothetical protein
MYSKEIKQKVIAEWDAGKTLAKLSAEHGPSVATIGGWVQGLRRSCLPRQSQFRRFDPAIGLRLEDKGFHRAEIARMFNVSKPAVTRALQRQLGLQPVAQTWGLQRSRSHTTA